ncbi:CDK-activating kinase assembly factor MAT1 [Homalodisca vitripennis]|nr:CDK-activating kinase assembly factor MAT1 [Homalodisca vitripennis]
MPLSPTDCARAVPLVDSGLTLREVENITGFPRSSISRAVIHFRLTGSYERRQGSGRNRTTSARDDRFVVSSSGAQCCGPMSLGSPSDHQTVVKECGDGLERDFLNVLYRQETVLMLGQALQEEWNNLDQELILGLIDSIGRRLQAVIRARGGNTRY